MGAVRYRARANLRHRAFSTLLLAVAVALPAGIVLTSVVGAQRTREALPAFVAANAAYDTIVFVDPGPEVDEVLDQVEDLPAWEVRQRIGAVVVAIRDGEQWVAVVPTAYVDGEPYVDQERPLVVEGRLPDPDRAEEVAINEDFARALGLHAGDQFDLRTITPAGLGPIIGGQADPRDPDGEDLTMTVAGIIRRPADLRTSVDQNNESVGSDSWHLSVGPAFVERFGDRLANFGFGIGGRVRPGQRDELEASIDALGRQDVAFRSSNESATLVESVGRGIDFEANAVLLFAAIVTLAGLAFVGQAVGRQVFTDLDGDGALRSMGFDRRQSMAVPLVRSSLVAAVGALGALLVAAAASAVFPIGLARQTTLDRGVQVDVVPFAIGALVVMVLVVGWAALAAIRLTRSGAAGQRAPSSATARSASAVVARAGAPVTVTAGVRLALERGRGRTAVPVLGALAATTAGVLLLSAVLVFGASLDHLVGSPEEQGWTWDAVVGNFNSVEEVRMGAQALRDNADVEAFNGFTAAPALLDGQEVYTLVLGPGDSTLVPPVLEGRAPSAADEIAVGTDTLAALDKQVGDTVTVEVAGAGAPSRTFRVVGTTRLPAGLDNELTFGRGALVTLAGARATIGGGTDGVYASQFLVVFADGVTPAQAADSLRPAFGGGPDKPREAPDVANLGRVQGLPRLLALLVGLLALGTLVNALFSSVRRRRREFGTYAAIGFRRGQLASTVAWQATTFAVIAVVIGLPLGVAAGRTVWTLIMGTIGTTTAPTVPGAALAAVAVGAVIAANLVALVPARSAARTRPAAVLRSE